LALLSNAKIFPSVLSSHYTLSGREMHPVTELLLEVWNKHEKKLKLLKYSKTVPDDIIKM